MGFSGQLHAPATLPRCARNMCLCWPHSQCARSLVPARIRTPIRNRHYTFRNETLAPRLARRTKPHTPCENLPLGRLSRTSLQVWPHTCNVQGKVRTTLDADGEEKTLWAENEENRSEWELGAAQPFVLGQI